VLSRSLIYHTDGMSNAVCTVRAEIELHPQGNLHLRYELTGDLAQLRIPAPQPPIAVDGLWEHTCFEVFVAVEDNTSYHEFNFSPSGQWAAYAFSDYRERSVWMTSHAPTISFVQTNDHLLLEAVIVAADLPQNPKGRPLQLGLTAVIETNDGGRTYWALHHPEPDPDFHHRAGFILSLTPA